MKDSIQGEPLVGHGRHDVSALGQHVEQLSYRRDGRTLHLGSALSSSTESGRDVTGSPVSGNAIAVDGFEFGGGSRRGCSCERSSPGPGASSATAESAQADTKGYQGSFLYIYIF